MIYHHNPFDLQTRRYLFWSMVALTVVFFFCLAGWRHQTAMPALPLSDPFAAPGLHSMPPADGITASTATQ